MKYFRQSTLTTLWDSRYFYSHFMDREIEAKADEVTTLKHRLTCMYDWDGQCFISLCPHTYHDPFFFLPLIWISAIVSSLLIKYLLFLIYSKVLIVSIMFFLCAESLLTHTWLAGLLWSNNWVEVCWMDGETDDCIIMDERMGGWTEGRIDKSWVHVWVNRWKNMQRKIDVKRMEGG